MTEKNEDSRSDKKELVKIKIEENEKNDSKCKRNWQNEMKLFAPSIQSSAPDFSIKSLD